MARASLGAVHHRAMPGAGDTVSFLSEPAVRLRQLSIERHGPNRVLEMVGQSASFLKAIRQVEKIARYREPVLITGESGVGKEHFAHALYLLGCPRHKPYVTVNCPQYQEGNLTVSELFGHVKGSFTGATADRRGAFEEADGGVIFLDEIGDLPTAAQALLLRALATGEFRPVGAASGSRRADVRVVSATNRDLNELVMINQFRYDLFFRLRHFLVELPPLRERGDDWRLIADHTLFRLARKYGVSKRFSSASLQLLENNRWPGNVRQLIAVVSTGYGMAEGELIEPEDFSSLLDDSPHNAVDSIETRYERIVSGGEDFWTVIGQPFLERDLNRSQVKTVVRRGLSETTGNYRRVVSLFNLPSSDYQKFMDFLRHHDLKP
jgi:two-component system response regulator AtoC